MPNIMDPVLPISSTLGYWAIVFQFASQSTTKTADRTMSCLGRRFPALQKMQKQAPASPIPRAPNSSGSSCLHTVGPKTAIL